MKVHYDQDKRKDLVFTISVDNAARASDYKAALETADQESEYTCKIIEGKE